MREGLAGVRGGQDDDREAGSVIDDQNDNEQDLDEKAAQELETMLCAVNRDVRGYFQLGRYRAKKKLSNGYTVTIAISEPRGGKRR